MERIKEMIDIGIDTKCASVHSLFTQDQSHFITVTKWVTLLNVGMVQGGSCGGNTYTDNCARSDGHIRNLKHREQDLQDFTKKVMRARQQHPAMYRRTNGKTFQGNTYFNCKYDPQTKDKVVYVTTLNWDPITVNYMVGGYQLIDLVTGKRISGNGGTYTIHLPGLGTRIFQVVEGNTFANNQLNIGNVVTFESNSSNAGKQKKYNLFIIIGGACVGLVVVIAIVVAIFMKFHNRKENSNEDYNPLLDE